MGLLLDAEDVLKYETEIIPQLMSSECLLHLEGEVPDDIVRVHERVAQIVLLFLPRLL